MKTRDAATLYRALRDGARLHGFLSGGGLRVVALRKDDVDVGYGEHPHIEEALRILVEDYRAGGRPYAAVYGEIETHYLTGSPDPTTPLDAWVRRGCPVDAWWDVDAVVVELRSIEDLRTPLDVHLRARGGETVRWTARGYEYESCSCKFANGERGTETRTVSGPEPLSRAWHWEAKRTGRGETFAHAVDVALAADPVECP